MTRRSFFAGLFSIAATAVGPRRDRLRVYAARATYRYRGPLEAVGVDWDGSIKPVRELSVDGPVTRVALVAPRSRGRT